MNPTYVWIIIFLLIILYIVSYIIFVWGVSSTWYYNLVPSNISPHWIGVGWLIISLSIGLSMYFSLNSLKCEDRINPLFYLVGAILLLIWVLVLYMGHNMGVAMWVMATLFIYHFWLILYLGNRMASYFLYPVLLVYIGFFYYTIHLISKNDIDV